METTAVLAGVGYGWDVWYWLSLFFLLFLFLIGAPLIMHIWGSEPETQPQEGGEADPEAAASHIEGLDAGVLTVI